MNEVIFAGLLIGVFAIGAVVIVTVIVFGIFRRVTDKRTRDERRADEYGDMRPGSFKVTPGIGGDVDGGTGAV